MRARWSRTWCATRSACCSSSSRTSSRSSRSSPTTWPAPARRRGARTEANEVASPVQATLEDFIKALRASDVRVSPAEAIDAHRALMEVGYGDRTLVKDALCITLAKSETEVARFDECFETYFTRDEFRGEPASD